MVVRRMEEIVTSTAIDGQDEAERAGGTPAPRTVVLSRRRATQHVWQASQYEFEDVIADVDSVNLLAPDGGARGMTADLRHKATNRARRLLHRPRRSVLRRTDEAIDADLFFAVFSAPHEIADLAAVARQVDRSQVKIAYLIEMWNSQVAGSADYLQHLRGFDHVFVFNRNVIPAVEQIAGVPCSYLPHAVDTIRFAPKPPGPPRTTDVFSFGRKMHKVTHRALVEAMEAGRLMYSFDTIRGPFEVTDYRDHRVVLAAHLQRSRYSVVHKISDTTTKQDLLAGEEMLTTRYFEVAATGALILGTAPDLPDYRDAFDWPDALIPISVPEPEIEELIRELDANPARLERARRANITQSLRRHDWAYRWQDVLRTAGLEPAPGLDVRLGQLAARADAYDEMVDPA